LVRDTVAAVFKKTLSVLKYSSIGRTMHPEFPTQNPYFVSLDWEGSWEEWMRPALNVGVENPFGFESDFGSDHVFLSEK
jgi:hypothetical protein